MIAGVLVVAGAGGAVGAAVKNAGDVQTSDYLTTAPPTHASVPASTPPPAKASVAAPPALASQPTPTHKPKPQPTPTFSPTSSHTVQAPMTTLAQLPINTELTGSAAQAWADQALSALGAPADSANVQTMVDWFANEGIPHALNNPLNLQTPEGGSTVSTDSGADPSAGIQAYPSPADFVAAFPAEMNNGSYPAIVAALKSGQGLEGNTSGEIQNELNIYSGGGYDSIPAHH